MRKLILLPIALIVGGGLWYATGWLANEKGRLPSVFQPPTTEGIRLDVGDSLMDAQQSSKDAKLSTLSKVNGAEGMVTTTISGNGKMLVVNAALPELQKGSYKVIVGGKVVNQVLGNLRLGKGGYILETTLPEELQGKIFQIRIEKWGEENTAEPVRLFEGQIGQ